MRRTLPAALAIGMAQHTTLGVERPFVDMRGWLGEEWGEMKRERDKNKRGRRLSSKREFKMSA